MGSRSLRFAEAGRVLAQAARRRRLVVPTFRSPPRVLGRDRTLRRRRDGSVAVAVRLDGRPFAAVLADMVEGVVSANRLEGPAAEECRRDLWNALQEGASEVITDAA